jgi:hypothetical protein
MLADGGRFFEYKHAFAIDVGDRQVIIVHSKGSGALQ